MREDKAPISVAYGNLVIGLSETFNTICTTKVASGAKELALEVHFVKWPNARLSSDVHYKTPKVCSEALSVLSDVN